MPLGSALISKIDIDFTRAQGVASEGRIWFQPPRQKVGTTMLSGAPIPVRLVQGLATVDLVRLPQGTYRVVEQLDGRPDRSYDFALPLTAPDLVQYENIVQVNPVPAKHQYVSTVNGIAPDMTTGNLTLELGGASNLNELTDVTLVVPENNQTIVYSSSDSQWKNLALALVALTGSYGDLTGRPTIPDGPEDIGAAALLHQHTVSQITDFVSSVDARIQSIVGAAPSSLDTLVELSAALNNDADFAATVTAALATKAALAHAHAMSDITDLVSVLTGKQPAITSRSLYITSGTIDPLPNTGAGWAAVAVEGSIPAAVGDRIRVGTRGIRNSASNVYLDLATVTGSGPTVIRRFLTTGTSTPAAEGDPAWYHSNAFINQSAPRQITVQSADRDGANVRISAVCKGNGTGRLYAEAAYPFYMLLENLGPEPA